MILLKGVPIVQGKKVINVSKNLPELSSEDVIALFGGLQPRGFEVKQEDIGKSWSRITTHWNANVLSKQFVAEFKIRISDEKLDRLTNELLSIDVEWSMDNKKPNLN